MFPTNYTDGPLMDSRLICPTSFVMDWKYLYTCHNNINNIVFCPVASAKHLSLAVSRPPLITQLCVFVFQNTIACSNQSYCAVDVRDFWNWGSPNVNLDVCAGEGDGVVFSIWYSVDYQFQWCCHDWFNLVNFMLVSHRYLYQWTLLSRVCLLTWTNRLIHLHTMSSCRPLQQ